MPVGNGAKDATNQAYEFMKFAWGVTYNTIPMKVVAEELEHHG